MVQIPVGSGKFGEVTLLEGSAVQLPETAEFLPHGTAGRQVFALPPVPDGKVNEFLEAGKGAYGAAFFPGFKGLQDTGSFAADVGPSAAENSVRPNGRFPKTRVAFML